MGWDSLWYLQGGGGTTGVVLLTGDLLPTVLTATLRTRSGIGGGSMADELGAPVVQDMTRSEDDTDDVTVHLTNADGTDASVTGWTAVLSVGADSDGAATATFSGTGIAGGLIPIDMSTFAVPIGSYKYDIRIRDTVTSDQPYRVYFKGKFRVTSRIN